MSDDTRTVLLTRANKEAADYINAVVHPDQESAEAGLAEVTVSAPWYAHSIVSHADFAEQAAKAEKSEGSE